MKSNPIEVSTSSDSASTESTENNIRKKENNPMTITLIFTLENHYSIESNPLLVQIIYQISVIDHESSSNHNPRVLRLTNSWLMADRTHSQQQQQGLRQNSLRNYYQAQQPRRCCCIMETYLLRWEGAEHGMKSISPLASYKVTPSIPPRTIIDSQS